MKRTITLEVDDIDFDTIQKEFTSRQAIRRPLPDCESNLTGAMVAEIVRDLVEYREKWEDGRAEGE
ncbi:hypothetical protein [Gimesia maris]|uniref:hypothetical protein n=1 Tax=Gimesia maris TaxID=122 RepID=UPI0032EF35C6